MSAHSNLCTRLATVSALALAALIPASCKHSVDCGSPPALMAGEAPAPKMLPYLTCQAEGNDAQVAQVYLGRIYDQGNLGAAQDYAQAAKWYEMAARDRPPSGPSGVYLPPVGDQKYGAWIPLTQQPGARGSAQAQYRLGVFFRDGLGVAPDLDKARTWFKKAAEQNHQPAVEALARLPH